MGLGVAVEYALGLGMTNMCERIHGLAALMRRKLLEQPGITIHDKGRRLCGIVSFTLVSIQTEKGIGWLVGLSVSL